MVEVRNLEPMPLVQWRQPVVDPAGWLDFDPPTETRRLPQDLVLCRDGLLDFDLDSDDAVVAFLEKHGMISRRFTLFDDYWYPRRANPLRVRRPAARTAPFRDAAHVSDVRAFLRAARGAARHFIAERDGENLIDAWVAEGYPRWLFSRHTDAMVVFTNVVNAGLRGGELGARMVLRLSIDFPTSAKAEARKVRVDMGGEAPGLFSAMCVQIAALMVENAPLSHCANDNCGRAFVHQIGRATHHYRSTGIMYCSNRCARAQNERDRRKRLAR